eukprot:c26762_g4_i1 orf=609-1757(+)
MPSFVSYMLSACVRPCNRNSPGAIDRRDSLLWHTDLKKHASGDFSIAVVQANQLLEDQSQVHTGSYGTYIGVYDGHGGPEASRFISTHLFDKIQKFKQEQGGMTSEVLKKAFKAVEQEFLRIADKSWRAKPQIAVVGSCCLVGVIEGSRLYVANLGDSRAVLGSAGNANKRFVAKRLSAEHNVGNEAVRQELKAQHPDDSHIVVQKEGVWRVKGIIQVSRTIGDIYLKKPELNRDPLFVHIYDPLPFDKPVLTAEPSIYEHTLHCQDQFLIFASDGLWDLLSDQEAVDIVSRNPRTGIAKRLIQAALHGAAKKWEMHYSELRKIGRGNRRNFHDDISVVVVYLDHDLIHMNQHSISAGSRSDIVNTPMDVYSPDVGRFKALV